MSTVKVCDICKRWQKKHERFAKVTFPPNPMLFANGNGSEMDVCSKCWDVMAEIFNKVVADEVDGFFDADTFEAEGQALRDKIERMEREQDND